MDTKKALKEFDIDTLDMMEQQNYEHFSISMSKEEALQVIINSVEEDFSQLSDGLREIAIQQENSYREFKVLPNNKYGCGYKREDNKIIGVHINEDGSFGDEEEEFEVREVNFAKGKESREFVEDMIKLLGEEANVLYPIHNLKQQF